MRLFLDTEFADFIDCELISVGIVTDDGREFYGERPDYTDASCSVFVREAVLPQLGQHPDRVFTREGLKSALLAWLDQFRDEAERIFCVDYAGDWELLVDLLDELPDGWAGLHIGGQIDNQRLESYFARHKDRHHALVDARACRYSVRDASTVSE